MDDLEDFTYFHIDVIQSLLNMDTRNNNYLSLYYSSFLLVNICQKLAIKMLQFISLSLKYIDKYSKSLIIDKYYYHYASLFKHSSRKNYFLCRKHLKYSRYIFSKKYLFKLKLKFNPQKLKKSKMQLYSEYMQANITSIQRISADLLFLFIILIL